MTDRDTVEEFCRIVECGSVGPEKRARPPRKPVYVWTIANRQDVERILLAFLPRLASRRTEKALDALMEIEKRKSELSRTCEGCGERFEAATHGPTRKFCSRPCYGRTYHAKYRGVPVAERAMA